MPITLAAASRLVDRSNADKIRIIAALVSAISELSGTVPGAHPRLEQVQLLADLAEEVALQALADNIDQPV